MSADKIRAIARTNEAIAANHTPWGKFSDLPNMKAVVVLSCMDVRSDPKDFWNTGEVAIVRNIEGSATPDALRSIEFLAGVMSNGRNTVGAVAVVHHTDCLAHTFSNEQVREGLKRHAKLGDSTAKELDGVKFGSRKEARTLEDSVKDDMDIIKHDLYLPKELQVLGYVYDVVSGVTTEV